MPTKKTIKVATTVRAPKFNNFLAESASAEIKVMLAEMTTTLDTIGKSKTVDSIDTVRRLRAVHKALMSLKEGFDDDDDEIVDKRPAVNIPSDKLSAVKDILKSMNPQKRSYAERILDWIKNGAKAGSRPSAISFGLGSFSASSVEDAFREIGLWPRGVRI